MNKYKNIDFTKGTNSLWNSINHSVMDSVFDSVSHSIRSLNDEKL